MVKNIPNKYTKQLMLQKFDKNFRDAYDFFYLPIDFKNQCNMGYAFLNFVDSKYIKPFYQEMNGKKWEKFNSEKVCKISYARIQGRAELERHFKDSSVMNQNDVNLRPYIIKNIAELVKAQKSKETSE